MILHRPKAAINAISSEGAKGPQAPGAFGAAFVVAVFTVSIGCGNDPAEPNTQAIDLGPPPADLPPTPPANEASPSTNVSTFPVFALDDPACAHATQAMFAFYHKTRRVHFHTNDFNEGLKAGYTYESPMNLWVESLPGTVPVYRCHRAEAATTYYLSTDVKCEGGVPDNRIVGYLHDPASPQPPGSLPWYRSSLGLDSHIHNSPTPPANWQLNYLMGYGPSLACKNLATTCQPYPSDYTGYTVNPGPDPDTGKDVKYSDRAPNPPWFGTYGRANQSGRGSDAILTGDWGTNNNVDWAPDRTKAECGYTDWMTGLSKDPNHGGAPHAFRCAMSEFKLGPRNFNSSCKTLKTENMGAAGATAFRNKKADWDPGYTKLSCGSGAYLAGVSSNHHDWSHLDGLLCCSEPALAAEDCTTVVFGATSPEEHTSVAADENGAIAPYDWDPPWEGNVFQRTECGAGRRMMGASKDKDSKLHAILCCRTPTPPVARANVSCCSPQTLQKALGNCNADNKTYHSDCENIVAPCCNSDPNSDGYGGGLCAATSAAMAADASTPDGDPNATVAGATGNDESACGASGAPLAWSYGHIKKGGGGNKTFGGNYTGELALAAGPIYANATASVDAEASLFGKKLVLARAEVYGDTVENDPLTARITALGKDLFVYPQVSSGHTNPFDVVTKTHEVTFFENTQIISIFAVPITLKGTIGGDISVTASVGTGGNTLSFNATPSIGATATCSAALGGGKGAFSLTAGVEGSLNLFHAALPTVAKVSPYTNHVTYNFHTDLKLTSLDGSVVAFLRAKLKPYFKKKFDHTVAQWGGLSHTVPLFSYTGCMSY